MAHQYHAQLHAEELRMNEIQTHYDTIRMNMESCESEKGMGNVEQNQKHDETMCHIKQNCLHFLYWGIACSVKSNNCIDLSFAYSIQKKTVQKHDEMNPAQSEFRMRSIFISCFFFALISFGFVLRPSLCVCNDNNNKSNL